MMMAIGIAFLPFYGDLATALMMLIVMGTGSGAWDSATSIWLVDMWPIGNSAILQGSQFMYGLGSIVSPILVSPFVYGEMNKTSDNKTITIADRIDSLAYPFIACGIIQSIGKLTINILFIIILFVYP